MAAPDPHRSTDDPHGDEPLETAGTALENASAAVVLIHGRGATARSILGMAGEFGTDGVASLAPQAAGNTWYPNSFLAPVAANEPGRTSGLEAIAGAIERANGAGIPTERVLVLGFSQGACLATEFVARNPRRYGGLVALSGGLIGDSIDPETYEGRLEGTPAFFGCSDVDPHIPEQRVHDSAAVLERLGADVTTRIYPGMGHGVNEDELAAVSRMVDALPDE
ncbi:alpha/beta hydrolase [Natronobeatus ordinarius]|uniref:alpha/beta hydrolase n=1 Tax=Natronobeatus ordinarius TaxID=2963433 RepID=UPI0020CEBF02|nr:dienelactone hydrolase family protein [Natronobeatus ordinarius]